MKMQTHRELSSYDLNRIERLVEATTPGPWYSYVVGRDADAESNHIELGWCNELGSFKSMEVLGGTVADQDFIASARQDLPRLLLEVRTLRAKLDAMRDMMRDTEMDLRMHAIASAARASAHSPERRHRAR